PFARMPHDGRRSHGSIGAGCRARSELGQPVRRARVGRPGSAPGHWSGAGAVSSRATGWSDLPHLVAFGLIHATVAGIRPTVSYRALDLGASAWMIGIIGGSFAALSLVAAIPIGSRIDRRGERVFFMAGATIITAAAVTAALAEAVVMLAVSQALLGLG